MKFYPADWRADPRLRMCSLAARGLWIDLIAYMHEGQPYGHLTIDGVVPTEDDIASLVARPATEVKKALAELGARTVFGRDEISGAIVSRRMVKDKAKSELNKTRGKLGGNPSLKKQDKPEVNPADNRDVETEDKAQILEARIQKEVDTTLLPDQAPIKTMEQMAAENRASGNGLISDKAYKIAAAIGVIEERNPSDPALNGYPGVVQGWLTKGVLEDQILWGVTVTMTRRKAKRKKPPGNLTYYEGPIADAIANASEPLPVGQPGDQNADRGYRTYFHPGPSSSAADHALADLGRRTAKSNERRERERMDSSASPDAA